ncbi:MAG: SMC-Scp complex subunit ScpB [Tenericutes bacterium HGW-Tenericutes-4]|nr:MAG: SMC-Scp complex subunit ScpB [Tenericutes bacterium HGW-Tenericutes-4]
MNNLAEILEAILFVSGDSIGKDDILDKLNILEEELDEAIAFLQQKYGTNSGIQVITFHNKIQLCSNSDYAEQVATVLNPIRERKLSKAMLETMAIIAYKQPITRLEVENIRGVNSDYALQNLLKHSLIEVVGRKDALGKPMLFGTTDEFLKRFELKSLKDLPDYNDLMSSIEVLHAQTSNTLYNDFQISEEEEELASLNSEEVFEKSLKLQEEAV